MDQGRSTGAINCRMYALDKQKMYFLPLWETTNSWSCVRRMRRLRKNIGNIVSVFKMLLLEKGTGP